MSLEFKNNPIRWTINELYWWIEYLKIGEGRAYEYVYISDDRNVSILGKSRDAVREVVNSQDVFTIDLSGDEARIKIHQNGVLTIKGDLDVFYGVDTPGINIGIWSDSIEGLEDTVNRTFRINPIGEELVIEIPAGLSVDDWEDYDIDEIYV